MTPETDKPTAKASPDKPSILRAVAEKILTRNLANLASKVQDGKTLNATELAMLQEAEGDSANLGWASSQVELSTALGVTRKSIGRWLKMPGNPGARSDGRYNVGEWRSWAESHGHKVDDVDITALKARQLILQNDQLEFRIGVMKRSYVPIGEVESAGGMLAAAIRKVVTTLHLSAPTLVGRPVNELEQLLKDREDEILQQLHLLHGTIDRIKMPVVEAEDGASAD